MNHLAIFGIGATYNDSKKDVTEKFLKNGLVCIGHPEKSSEDPEDCSPSLHGLLRHIKAGDIVYIKSFNDKGLYIKAIGIFRVFEELSKDEELGTCLHVKWLWIGPIVGPMKISDKYNVRWNALYEEYNPEVQKKIISLIPSPE